MEILISASYVVDTEKEEFWDKENGRLRPDIQELLHAQFPSFLSFRTGFTGERVKLSYLPLGLRYSQKCPSCQQWMTTAPGYYCSLPLSKSINGTLYCEHCIDDILSDEHRNSGSATELPSFIQNLFKRKQANCSVSSKWWEEYAALDLCGGELIDILEDDEDMLEIRYPDGGVIDVGFLSAINMYCITAVASDDEAGWADPVFEVEVEKRDQLSAALQAAIKKFREGF